MCSDKSNLRPKGKSLIRVVGFGGLTVVVAIQVWFEVGSRYQLRDVLFLAGAVTHTYDEVLEPGWR